MTPAPSARAAAFDDAQAAAATIALACIGAAARLVRAGARAALATLAAWFAVVRARRELAELDDRTLRDIGVDRALVLAEIDKPFWRQGRP